MDQHKSGAIAQIMVVDDDPDTVTVLARYLDGYSIYSARLPAEPAEAKVAASEEPS